MAAKCSHCGYPLSPTHVGPCPNCGKTGKTVTDRIVESLNIQGTVGTSGVMVFNGLNMTTPEYWPQLVSTISQNITVQIKKELPEILEQHDKEVELKNKKPAKRVMSIGNKLLWIFIGAILSLVISLVLGR